MGRNAQRRRSDKAERMTAAALRRVESENAKVNAYQSGYLDGYLACVNDIVRPNTINRVAARIIAVMHDNHQLAEYTVGIVQNVMRPASATDLLSGLKEATERWVARQIAKEAKEAEGQQVAS